MKKLTKVLAILVAVCVLSATAAFAATAGTYTDGDSTLTVADDGTFTMETAGEDMDGAAFTLQVAGTIADDGTVTITSLSDGEVDLIDLASEDQVAGNIATVEALLNGASGEASAEASGEAMSVEDAYVEYIREFLANELANNSDMTQEQIDDEFMPLIEAGDYETFPADMLYGGMLNTGVAMTFDEFAAQYVPETTAAAGDTSEEAYQAYLKSYVDACPAVTDEQYEEFAALIDAGNYTDFPVEMCFTDAYWGFVAATYDEFVAAGGNVELPAFDANLTADAEA